MNANNLFFIISILITRNQNYKYFYCLRVKIDLCKQITKILFEKNTYQVNVDIDKMQTW